MARALFENFEHLFTFIYHEGVEPTNNGAERAPCALRSNGARSCLAIAVSGEN
jgi:hypothetical protein